MSAWLWATCCCEFAGALVYMPRLHWLMVRIFYARAHITAVIVAIDYAAYLFAPPPYSRYVQILAFGMLMHLGVILVCKRSQCAG